MHNFRFLATQTYHDGGGGKVRYIRYPEKFYPKAVFEDSLAVLTLNDKDFFVSEKAKSILNSIYIKNVFFSCR